MKIKPCLLFLFLSAGCGLLWASQTNTVSKAKPEQEIEIDSGGGYFDGITNQIVYYGHVVVTDHVKATLHCERLTVDLPPNGGHPTNIVAETNVVIDFLDEKGQTNRVMADKAVYAYRLLNPVTNIVYSATNAFVVFTNVVYTATNETATFTGTNPVPQVEGPEYVITGSPLVYDVPTKHFSGWSKTIYKPHPGSGGTNASPFDFLKK